MQFRYFPHNEVLLVLCWLIFFTACGPAPLTTKELKELYGPFEQGETIKLRPIDLIHSPMGHIWGNSSGNFNPEYGYLEKVECKSIAYLSDGLFVTGFLVKPKKAGDYPCVIYNRGGNRDVGQLLYYHVAEVLAPLAAQGYVVAASNYRGNSGGEGQEEFGGNDVNDLLNLINSLAEIEGADTSRIGMLGLSRGGMMTYLAMKKSDNIDVAVIWGGIADAHNFIEYHKGIEGVFEDLVPNFSQNRVAELDKRSAVQWAGEMHPAPILLLHGSMDSHVSVQEAKDMAVKLTELDRPHRLMVFDGDNHGMMENREEAQQMTLEWFDRYLR